MDNKFSNRTVLIAGTVIVAGSLLIMYQWSKSRESQSTQSITTTTTNTNINKKPMKKRKKVKFPVQVFVRVRPLIKEEIEAKHDEMSWVAQEKHKKTGFASITIKNATDSKKKGKNSKIYHNFRTILKPADNNDITFEKCILPNLNSFFDGNIVCSFAYGHTGSGKTHTMLGYSNHNIPGMYELTAKHIFTQLATINNNNNTNDNNHDSKVLLEVRFAELYQGKMRDLLSANLVECHVREDRQGNMHIRGPTIKDEATGEVLIQPLTGLHANNVEDVIKYVNQAKAARNVGSSTKHDESSRSHAFLYFELVNNELIKARNRLIVAESELVPHGKARDDEKIFIEGSKFEYNQETGSYSVNEDWVNPDPGKIDRLEATVKVYEKRVDEAQDKVNEILDRNREYGVGGTVVFVDLAGNEWGQDSKVRTGKGKDTPQQARERKEINKSLLSLKECIRGLHSDRSHINFRDSKLTMVLREHLAGDYSTAIMIANISPSQEDIKKSLNTLQYSQLVAQA